MKGKRNVPVLAISDLPTIEKKFVTKSHRQKSNHSVAKLVIMHFALFAILKVHSVKIDCCVRLLSTIRHEFYCLLLSGFQLTVESTFAFALVLHYYAL